MPRTAYGFLVNGVLNAKTPTCIDDARAIDELRTAMTLYLANGTRT